MSSIPLLIVTQNGVRLADFDKALLGTWLLVDVWVVGLRQLPVYLLDVGLRCLLQPVRSA